MGLATTVDTMLSGVTGTIGARSAVPPTAAAYVPLSFAPGEAYQFDWSSTPKSSCWSGVTVIVKAAHVRLCPQQDAVRADLHTARETQEMVFDALTTEPLRCSRGACQRLASTTT